MRPDELATRVTVSGSVTLVALAAVAAWVGGVDGVAGAVGGGAVVLLNFRWLVRSIAQTAALGGNGRSAGGRLHGIWLRHLATFGTLGVLIGSGWTDPLWVVVGLSVLPPILIAEGLRAGRRLE